MASRSRGATSDLTPSHQRETPMAEPTTITIPKPNVPSIIEFLIDFVGGLFVLKIAMSAFLAPGVELQDQAISVGMVVIAVAIYAKWALSTKMFKRG